MTGTVDDLICGSGSTSTWNHLAVPQIIAYLSCVLSCKESKRRIKYLKFEEFRSVNGIVNVRRWAKIQEEENVQEEIAIWFTGNGNSSLSNPLLCPVLTGS